MTSDIGGVFLSQGHTKARAMIKASVMMVTAPKINLRIVQQYAVNYSF